MSEASRVHYTAIISRAFRSLQLDPDLHLKSIFDLIDYCVQLYEDLALRVNTPDGLYDYVRGYLIFNYFINSFVMVHFGGFDQFIKSNEQDFIIYLNVFAFYNGDDVIRSDAHLMPLKTLRKLTIDYLTSKKLLSFDVDELYTWLYEYIAYLKEKDSQEDQEPPKKTEKHLSRKVPPAEPEITTFSSSYSVLNDPKRPQNGAYSVNDASLARLTADMGKVSKLEAPDFPEASTKGLLSNPKRNSYAESIKNSFSVSDPRIAYTSKRAQTSDSIQAPKSRSAPKEYGHTLHRKANGVPEQELDLDGSDDSIFDFKARFPSINVKNGSSMDPPPPPRDAPPPAPVNQNSPPKATPYPIKNAGSFSDLETPYPLANISSDDMSFITTNENSLSSNNNGLSLERPATFSYENGFKEPNGHDVVRDSVPRIPQYSPPIPQGIAQTTQSVSSIPQSHRNLLHSGNPSWNQNANLNWNQIPNPSWNSNPEVHNGPSHSDRNNPLYDKRAFSRPPVPVPTLVHVNGYSYPQPLAHPQTFPQKYNNHFQQSSQQYFNSNIGPFMSPPQDYHYQSQQSQLMPAHSLSIIPHHVQTQQNQIKHQKNHLMKEYGVCGLRNFGSSCYINLTVQVLFAISELRDLFTSQKYYHFIKDPKYVALMKTLQKLKDTLLLSDAIAALLRSFCNFGGSLIAPSKFLRVSSSLKPDFNIPNEQQDAQEYLLFVLERLHDELSTKGDDTVDYFTLESYVKKWHININSKDKEKYFEWYKLVLKGEGTSPVHDVFQGHLQNKLICNKCGFESINYSPFTILSLPIPSSNHRNTVDLADCLRYYTQDEVMTGDNAWSCPKCFKSDESQAGSVLDTHPVFTSKKSGIFRLNKRSKSPSKKKEKTNALQQQLQASISIKRLNFIKLPQVLFIHLSRFSVFNLTDKLDTVIKYPLELKFNSGTHEIGYKLVGLINHYGNLKSGHYTSLTNKSGDAGRPCWCYFDDDQVKVNLAHGDFYRRHQGYGELELRDVYVLCYERL